MRRETKIMYRGLCQIELEKWEEDETGALNMLVTNKEGNIVHCIMKLLPAYSELGHIELSIDGIKFLNSSADRFPRYFFSFQEADHHCRTFLKWHLWQHRSHYGWGEFMNPLIQLYRASAPLAETETVTA